MNDPRIATAIRNLDQATMRTLLIERQQGRHAIRRRIVSRVANNLGGGILLADEVERVLKARLREMEGRADDC